MLLLLSYLIRNKNKQSFTTQYRSSDTLTAITKKSKIYYTQLSDFYPAVISSHQIVNYSGFSLSYNEDHEQADWVIYLLTEEMTWGIVEREDKFRVDSNILTKSAHPNDYKNSGYDRGHLVPAADMKWSEKSMKESFLMSNVSPQTPQFNRGIWKKLEEKIRDWAIEYDSIIVVTGPVFKDFKVKIGKNQVTVPTYFFKVILDISQPDIKAIAFLLKNEGSYKPLSSFAISVDSLEKFSDHDFFPNLNKLLIEDIESEFNPDKWNL